MTDSEVDDGLWVKTEVTPTGAYRTTITVGGDRAWSLGRDQAIEYAVACIARATEADHDAALWALCTQKMKVGDQAAGVLIADSREARGIDHSATEPLQFVPGVSAAARKPFLRMDLNGKAIGQLTPSALRRHAMGVFNALASIHLDETLVKVLAGIGGDGAGAGANENSARGLVMDLQNYWPADE